jgi:hypothetical protein
MQSVLLEKNIKDTRTISQSLICNKPLASQGEANEIRHLHLIDYQAAKLTSESHLQGVLATSRS